MKRKKNIKAFTIVELVIVIAVIAILAAVLIPIFGNVIAKANNSKAMQVAKNAYTQYMVEYAAEGQLAEYMVYDADGRFVALHNGAAVGVYDTPEDALKAMIANPDMSKLTVTNDGKLFAYGDVSAKESLIGKKISFMGDSISTYLNWSNNTAFNSTLGGNDERNNRVYYERDNVKGLLSSVHYTWWMKTVEELGLQLCVNNSWTGSRVTKDGGENKYGCGTRTQNLHNDNTNEYPDIIVVYLGTNDVSQNVKLGSFNSIDDIYNAQTGKYLDNQIDEFAIAYAVMVHKIKTNYPEADIYLCTVDQYAFNYSRNPIAYNDMITAIAQYFDCSIVDFYNGTSITPDTAADYLADSYLHPNAKGMAQMYECVKNALAEKYLVTKADDQPIFNRDIIQNLKVGSLSNSNTNLYMYTKSEVNQSLSGKTVTRIGVPIKSVADFTKESYFTVYVVDSTAPYTKHVEYEIVIPANRFSNNTVNQWAYFNVNIKLEEGQTLAFQPNASATLGFIGTNYANKDVALSEIGGFLSITTGTQYDASTVLYDIFVK